MARLRFLLLHALPVHPYRTVLWLCEKARCECGRRVFSGQPFHALLSDLIITNCEVDGGVGALLRMCDYGFNLLQFYIRNYVARTARRGLSAWNSVRVCEHWRSPHGIYHVQVLPPSILWPKNYIVLRGKECNKSLLHMQSLTSKSSNLVLAIN